MMFKVRQDLILQQSPKYPGLFNRLLQRNQVLNLTEGHQPLDPLLWKSILEDSKVSEVLGTSSWVVWILEECYLDPLSLIYVRSINLVYLLYLENKRN
jgi:hypothetical protein